MSSRPLCVVMLSIAKHPVTVFIALSSRPLCVVMLSIAKHPVTVLIALSSRPCAGISLHSFNYRYIPLCKNAFFFSLQKVNNFHFVDPPVSLRFSIFAANDSKIHHNSTSPDVRAPFG